MLSSVYLKSGVLSIIDEELREEENLTAAESKAIDQRIANEHFWDIGYNLLWKAGMKAEALKEFKNGLKFAPGDFKMWKTYLGALVRPAPSK